MKSTLLVAVVTMVPAGSLESLVEWGKSRHGYLFRDTHPLPSSQSELIAGPPQSGFN